MRLLELHYVSGGVKDWGHCRAARPTVQLDTSMRILQRIIARYSSHLIELVKPSPVRYEGLFQLLFLIYQR